MDRSNFIDRAIAANLVTEVLIPGEAVKRSRAVKCEKFHIWPTIFIDACQHDDTAVDAAP
jgi:hypothetical protein